MCTCESMCNVELNNQIQNECVIFLNWPLNLVLNFLFFYLEFDFHFNLTDLCTVNLCTFHILGFTAKETSEGIQVC